MRKAVYWLMGAFSLLAAALLLDSLPEIERVGLILVATIGFVYYKLDTKIESLNESPLHRCSFTVSVKLGRFGDVLFDSGIIILPMVPQIKSRIVHSVPKNKSARDDVDFIDFHSGEIAAVNWEYNHYACECIAIKFDEDKEDKNLGLVIKDFESMGWSLSSWNFDAVKFYEEWKLVNPADEDINHTDN